MTTAVLAGWRGAAVAVASLAVALVVLNAIAFSFGDAPLDTLGRAFAGTWGTPYGIGQVLFKATPLIFTGLAFEIAFRAGLFNIGAEGQLGAASLAGAYVATVLPATTPAILAIAAVCMVAMSTGGAVALVPGWMRARLGVHEIISTIMLNRVVDVALPFALAVGLGSSTLRTGDVVAGARIPTFESIAPSLKGSALSAAILLAVGAAVVTGWWLKRAKVGREITWVGLNPLACRAEGIPVQRRMVLAMVLSGAVAGLAMSGTVLGYKGYFELGLGAGAGFSGIAVALLARGRPGWIVLTAILFGTLQQAGLAINATVPKEAMGVLEAVVIVVVASATALSARERRT